jgi:hypothetical protein
MATLNFITDNIYNIYRNFTKSDDDLLTIRQISFLVHTYRAMYIRRDVERNSLDYSMYEQSLGCILLEPASKSECCDYNTTCTIMKSVKVIPTLLRLKSRIGLKLTSTDDSTDIPIIQQARAKYTSFSRFTNDKKYAFLRDCSDGMHLFVINDKLIERVAGQAVLADPTTAKNFVDCDGVSCWNADMSYPLGQDMINSITQEILTKELNIARYGEKDKENDASGKDTVLQGPSRTNVAGQKQESDD